MNIRYDRLVCNIQASAQELALWSNKDEVSNKLKEQIKTIIALSDDIEEEISRIRDEEFKEKRFAK